MSSCVNYSTKSEKLMDPSTIVNIVLSMILLSALIIITIRLFMRLRATKLKNLEGLIIFFIGQSILGFFMMASFQLGFYIVEVISFIALAFFINDTFYKNRKNSFRIVLLLLICLSIGIITFLVLHLFASIQGQLDFENLYYLLYIYFFTLAIFLVSLWYSSASYSAYNLIRDEKIDNNIKLRYKVLGFSSLIFALQGFITPIHVFLITFISNYNHQLYTIVNVVILVIFALGNLYAWVILGRKIEDSRKAAPSEDEISEEEMMKMIKEGT